MSLRHAVAGGILVLIACNGEDAAREPVSVVVVDDSGGRIVNSAGLSPDGRRLAYAQVVGAGQSAVFVSAADGTNPVRVSHGVWDATPTWSPDGKWIAYQGEDPRFDVYVVPSDGSGPARQITSGPEQDVPYAWLKDGTGVLFTRVRAGDERPMVARLDGRPPRRIGPVMQGNLHAAWSPNGALLGFDLHEGSRNTVWVQDSAAGSTPRQLTTEGLESAAQSMWSPDSKQIVYTSRRTGTLDIWILDVTTGQPRQLTNDVRDDFFPRWSPDGRWIAFVSDRGGQRDVWLVPSSGGNAVRLTNDAAIDVAPRWAPDGNSVFFLRTSNNVEAQLLPIAGGPARTLHAWEEYSIGSARLSPDGKSVIFDTDRVGGGEVFTLPLAGGEPTAFASSPRRESSPRYSPDGSQVALLSDRGGSMDIWLAPVAGGEARNLTSAPGEESEATWSPDGKQIAFTSSRDVSGGDLWVIPVSGGEPKRLTNQNVRPDYVQWSPDGSYLYFVGEKPDGTGDRDYFRVPAAGGRLESIGANPTIDFARLSGDGRRVAYASFEGGWAFLDLIPVSGGPSRRLTRETDNVYHRAAFWTLDDSLLVVAALDLASNRDATDLWTYRLSDGRWTRLTSTRWGVEDPMGFTPDGRHILVLMRTERTQIRRVSVAEAVSRRQ